MGRGAKANRTPRDQLPQLGGTASGTAVAGGNENPAAAPSENIARSEPLTAEQRQAARLEQGRQLAENPPDRPLSLDERSARDTYLRSVQAQQIAEATRAQEARATARAETVRQQMETLWRNEGGIGVGESLPSGSGSLRDMIQPRGRAPRGLGQEYKDRRGILSRIARGERTIQAGWTEAGRFSPRSQRGRYAASIARQRTQALRPAIDLSFQVAIGPGSWSQKRMLINEIMDNATAQVNTFTR